MVTNRLKIIELVSPLRKAGFFMTRSEQNKVEEIISRSKGLTLLMINGYLGDIEYDENTGWLTPLWYKTTLN